MVVTSIEFLWAMLFSFLSTYTSLVLPCFLFWYGFVPWFFLFVVKKDRLLCTLPIAVTITFPFTDWLYISCQTKKKVSCRSFIISSQVHPSFRRLPFRSILMELSRRHKGKKEQKRERGVWHKNELLYRFEDGGRKRFPLLELLWLLHHKISFHLGLFFHYYRDRDRHHHHLVKS